MSAWSEVRRLARLRHAELAQAADGLVPAALLLAAAEEKTGVRRKPRPPKDSLLDGAEAAYHRERRRIYYSNATEPALANFHVAHEYGHHWLDDAASACDHADLALNTPAEPGMSSVGDADAYSPKERAEAQANLFAREFLLPRGKLRERCLNGDMDARVLAAELGVPADLVMQQMADALLLPEEREAEPARGPEGHPDDSQVEAIRAPSEARVVRAGPGTGKTRTLVGRISHLVAAGEDPSSIVALTYSNAAAQDLSSRIRAAIGERATALWSGTFHAYGLELLRKYGGAIGLPVELKHIDRTDQLMLLEELLPKLELEHYLDLHEPLRALASILNAISRAKDELATPADYERCARQMLDEGTDDPSRLAARRALEVARVYAIYDATLRERGWLDFGDLIARSVELLQGHPETRAAIRHAKRHLLVDEYQDMNRASGVLLRELVEPGCGPWVVGDVRQAIYRFRGASPTNMPKFAEDFPGAQITDLSVNYRSGGKIVRTFEAFGNRMACAPLSSSSPHTADRGEGNGEVHYEVAATREAEAYGIANIIRTRVNAGGTFGSHAILGKTHTVLARIASVLERAGVPCLYFGDFFERAEIRDLLALLSVASELKGVGLLRVAQFPQYGVPPSDVTTVCAWRREERLPMLAAVRRSAEIDGVSTAGRQGLARLAADLVGVDWPMTAHTFLMKYLFETESHLGRLLSDETVAGMQRRLAVYQLLLFALPFKAPAAVEPKGAFLSHIRRLEVLDEEKQLRQLPAAAADIDAVRLMTIHASKGLEFPSVHIPALTKANFPSKGKPEACPLPKGLLDENALMTRDAEEESVFFVALSRARDFVFLSRALTNGGQSTKNPSNFLTHVAKHLPRSLDGAAGWTATGPTEPPWPLLWAPPLDGVLSSRSLETYLDCPRRYYYEHVLALSGSEESSPYLKFQSAIHATIAWMRSVASSKEREDGLATRLDDDWKRIGPSDHPFGPIYRAVAEKMLKTAASVMGGDCLPTDREVRLVATGHVVRCRVDHVEATTGGVVIRRLKTSTLAKDEKADPRYTLWQAAILNDHPDQDCSFEHVSLLNGERRSTPVESAKVQEQLRIFEGAIEGISAGRFDPKPHTWCPNCAYYFICPSHGVTL